MFKKYVLQHKKRQQQVFVTIRVYRKTVFDIFFVSLQVGMVLVH